MNKKYLNRYSIRTSNLIYRQTEQDQLRYLKVIGNVHDNPELLEEVEE